MAVWSRHQSRLGNGRVRALALLVLAFAMSYGKMVWLYHYSMLVDHYNEEELAQDTPPKKGELSRQQAYDMMVNEEKDLPSLMDETVRLLFPSEQDATRYIRLHDSFRFKFYVYDDLPDEYTWRNISVCIESKPVRGRSGSNCDWGASICTEVKHSVSSQYSGMRYNRNADAVLAKLFDTYRGSARTFDPSEATIFVVPYAYAGHCFCRSYLGPCRRLLPANVIEEELFDKLRYLNRTTLTRHLFFSSVVSPSVHTNIKRLPLLATIGPIDQRMCKPGKNCGQIAMPYANTNADYQPPQLEKLNEWWWTDRPRKYSIGAILSKKIPRKNNAREQFVDNADELFGGKIGGLPINITQMGRDRKMKGEQGSMELLRDSVFCPCLSGDTPSQKRFFDVIMSGCIPVVLAYNVSNEDGYPSYFNPRGSSIRTTYPFALGVFHGEPSMGIDYESMVVSVDGSCGLPCMKATLEAVMNDAERLRSLRRNIMRCARLLSFGMEGNAFRHTDVVSAILVQARHYVDMLTA